MDKQEILSQIIAVLESEAASLAQSANAAYEDATHGESKAENKYDTRGLLASYLAGAQSHRFSEVRKMIGLFRAVKAEPFEPDQAIAVGALVQLRCGDERFHAFLGPGGAGIKVVVDGMEIQVVSARSPLGDAMRGKTEGEAFKLQIQGLTRDYEILTVA